MIAEIFRWTFDGPQYIRMRHMKLLHTSIISKDKYTSFIASLYAIASASKKSVGNMMWLDKKSVGNMMYPAFSSF